MQTAVPSVTPQAAFHPAPLAGAPVDVGWADLCLHRAHLVQYARRRLMDPSLAEDLVHDVFEAVASGRAAFAGRSALRSWLVGILKHKIVDLVRQRSGHDSLQGTGAAEGDDDEAAMEIESPLPGPQDLAEQRQRLRHTLARIQSLPVALRRVVEMRLLHERSSSDVCQALQISEQNLFVRLHRARRALAS
jgi:RNA polymerase sigma-70 factor (ECF subfamily)